MWDGKGEEQGGDGAGQETDEGWKGQYQWQQIPFQLYPIPWAPARLPT